MTSSCLMLKAQRVRSEKIEKLVSLKIENSKLKTLKGGEDIAADIIVDERAGG